MRLFTPLKDRALRYLGVVSPSGRYPLPPGWALSELGKHRFYDDTACELACCKPQPEPFCTPDCGADCCGPLVVSAGVLPASALPRPCVPRCPVCNDPADPVAADRENGREEGAQA